MIQTNRSITLSRARDEVCDALRDMILSGDIRPDGRMEEIELSARLGVSRTPVREALIALEQEGLVASRPNRGFLVLPIDADLVRETYPVLGALEAAAVRLGGERLKEAVPRLRELNRKLATERNRARQHELDHAFHALLTGASGNARLASLLRAEWNRARRFDGAHERGMADQDGSCAQHEEIIVAIEAGRFEAAGRSLDEHWRRGIEVVVKWLNEKS
jgi:DNA-binding GntR family transcriptional regulator